jgi:phosphate transport system ATP-binding protein
MGKAIEAKNLNIYYGSFLAVEGVNMSIRPQTVTALIGPSGCGKSTFLRSVNRMHEVIPGAHVKGTLELDGKDLYGAASTRSVCAARSAWSSSGPTRSPRCRSTTT